jgi:lipopolysaccharide/colanic/teichoic acid biosynthesis glycosyltransferase
MLETELLTDRIIAPAPARRASRHGWYPRQGKAVFDALAAAALLALLAPVLAVTALVVLVTLGRPVLFLQERVGKSGRNFTIYKFRTMTADRRAGFRAHAGEDRRRTHKSARDPRLAAVGRFLRGSSLDELPQLLNVLRGDMSLVGPRPEMVDIVDRHGLRDHPRHGVKPGITGLWQVSARGDGLLHQNVHVDLAYLDRITPAQDLRILLRTIPAALWGQRGM